MHVKKLSKYCFALRCIDVLPNGKVVLEKQNDKVFPVIMVNKHKNYLQLEP